MEDKESPLSAHRARTLRLLESWDHIPGVLVDFHLDVVASNASARALTSGFSEGVNLARFAFLDPLVFMTGARWADACAQILGMLRESLDQHGSDRGLLAIVGDLSAENSAFADVWLAEIPSAAATGEVTFFDTAFGPIALAYSLIRFPDVSDDILIAFRPPNEASYASLERLIDSIRTR